MKNEAGDKRENLPGNRETDFTWSSSTCMDRVLRDRGRIDQYLSLTQRFHGDTYFLLMVAMTEWRTPSLKDRPLGLTTATVCVAPPTSPTTASTAPEARWTDRKCWTHTRLGLLSAYLEAGVRSNPAPATYPPLTVLGAESGQQDSRLVVGGEGKEKLRLLAERLRSDLNKAAR